MGSHQRDVMDRRAAEMLLLEAQAHVRLARFALALALLGMALAAYGGWTLCRVAP
jgi:hypothetical protein